MPLTLNGTTGIAGVDGSASTPSVQGSDTNTGEFFPAADTIAWTTGGSERMRVDSSGNVGIGTNSPSYLLDVQSSSTSATYYGGRLLSIANPSGTSTTYLRIEKGSGYGGAIGGYLSQSVGSGLVLTTANGGTFTDQMWITNAGNVGIGTSSPGDKLQVKKGTNQNLLIGAAATLSSGCKIESINDAGSANVGLEFRGSDFAWFSTGSERMRIDTSGNVGIGTSSPSTKFNVIGDIHVGTSGNTARISNSGNDIVQFFSARNGTGSYFYYNTSNGYGTTSDARSKNSITDINPSDALAYVMKLKPSSFKMNGDDKYQAGFIAQNCLEASQNDGQKSAVANYETYDEQDKDCPYLGVSDRPILAHAIAAIQELKSIIDAQAAEIAALKANAPA